MRIDLNHGPQPLNESSQSPSESPAVATHATEPGLGQDQAQLSGAGAQIAALAAQAFQLPEMRQERVEALRQAVQKGQYSIGSEQVAGAVFEHMMASAS